MEKFQTIIHLISSGQLSNSMTILFVIQVLISIYMLFILYVILINDFSTNFLFTIFGLFIITFCYEYPSFINIDRIIKSLDYYPITTFFLGLFLAFFLIASYETIGSIASSVLFLLSVLLIIPSFLIFIS